MLYRKFRRKKAGFTEKVGSPDPAPPKKQDRSKETINPKRLAREAAKQVNPTAKQGKPTRESELIGSFRLESVTQLVMSAGLVAPADMLKFW